MKIHEIQGEVDPFSPDQADKVLWCVHGPECFPAIFCCKINYDSGLGAAIWGYSVYRRKPGFRTLGQDLKQWIAERVEQDEDAPRFFDNQLAALSLVRDLTTPKAGAK